MTKAPFYRSQITHLRVEGYRSLKHIELEDLPPLVVIHGPNGTGKSNIIRTVQQLLYWASSSGPLPGHRDKARPLGQINLPTELRLTADDFSRGQLPEIRISLRMQIGSVARRYLGEALELPIELSLEGVAQNTGEDIIYWFDQATFGQRSLLSTENPGSEQSKLITEITTKQHNIQQHIVQLREYEQQVAKAIVGQDSYGVHEIRKIERQIREEEKAISALESQISKDELMLIRCKTLLLPSLLLHFSAYRTTFEVNRHDDRNHPMSRQRVRDFELQSHFLSSWISRDKARRQSIGQLVKRLQQAGYEIEGATPIWNSELGQAQLLLDTPGPGELPMSQVGTGMQQLIFLLGGLFANPAPIVVIEEPEAHLYKDTMLSLARYLKSAVEGDQAHSPDIDQLWIETHHHAFAIALEYLDVSKDQDGWTQVQKSPRSRAIDHFYEPGPFWDALRQLVEDALEDDDVVFRNPAGQPVTAGQMRASIDGDRALANEYVEALTEMTIAAMRKKATKGKG